MRKQLIQHKNRVVKPRNNISDITRDFFKDQFNILHFIGNTCNIFKAFLKVIV